MGAEWSCFPSVRRNTMCCVDVRTQKPFWYTPPNPHIHYRSKGHVPGDNIRYVKPVDPDLVDSRRRFQEIPANEVEFNAVVDVYAPVDTDRMIAQSGWRPPSPT